MSVYSLFPLTSDISYFSNFTNNLYFPCAVYFPYLPQFSETKHYHTHSIFRSWCTLHTPLSLYVGSVVDKIVNASEWPRGDILVGSLTF